MQFEREVLPYGDPFTYTIGWFELLDRAAQDYWRTLYWVVSPDPPNWYWLLNGLTALLSPILIKEAFSISLANFLLYLVGSLSFFFVARNLGASRAISFIAGLIIWIYPVNYGFSTYESVPVLGLDAAFAGACFLAVGTLLLLISRPESKWLALFAGLAAGLAIWGRGNSLPIVGMILCIPGLWLTYLTWRERSKAIAGNLILYVAIVTLMTVYYYAANWWALTNYYSNHVSFAERHAWNLADAQVWLLNLPGFMFWRDEGSVATIMLSFLSHAFMFLALWLSFWKRFRSTPHLGMIRLLAVSGAFIYFVQYGVNIAMFTDPLFSLYNVLLIYRPMLAGMTLAFLAMLLLFHLRGSLKAGPRILVPGIAVMVAWAITFTHLQTPWEQKANRPDPRDVERFAVGLDEYLEGGTLSLPWYGFYNPAIIHYYRAKNDLPNVPMYTHKPSYYNAIWSASDHSEKNRENTLTELKHHFENATVIIMPEFSDSYTPNQPYAFYKFKDDFIGYLNSPEAPKFRVLTWLDDHPGTRLMVMQREELANLSGVSLNLPYGLRSLQQEKVIDPATGRHLDVHFTGVDTLPSDYVKGPNGTAARIIETVGEVSIHNIKAPFQGDTRKAHRAVIWLRPEAREYFRLQMVDTYGRGGGIVDVRLVLEGSVLGQGDFGTAKMGSATIERLSNGWYKVTFSATVFDAGERSDGKVWLEVFAADAPGTLRYVGNGKAAFTIDGITLEEIPSLPLSKSPD